MSLNPSSFSLLFFYFLAIKSMDYVQCTHDSPLLFAAWHPHRFLGSLHMKGSISSLASPSGITPGSSAKTDGEKTALSVLIVC